MSELSLTCASQASAAEGYVLLPVVWSAQLPANPLEDPPIGILIAEAQATRLVAHVRAILSRLKPHVRGTAELQGEADV